MPVALATSGAGLFTLTAAWCGDPIVAAASRLGGGTPLGSMPLDLALTALAAVGLGASAGWFALVLLATAVEAVTGLSCVVARAVTPVVVRRTALVACGVAVAGAGTLGPATADASGPEDRSVTHASVVSGLPLPDRATGGAVTAFGSLAQGKRQVPRMHRVRPGESLWSIARSLDPHARPEEIALACRRLYRRNAAVVGADPDLILPGTPLVLPVSRAAAAPEPATSHRKDAS